MLASKIGTYIKCCFRNVFQVRVNFVTFPHCVEFTLDFMLGCTFFSVDFQKSFPINQWLKIPFFKIEWQNCPMLHVM